MRGLSIGGRDAMAGVIISASRRTDIPALYSGWFMERIRAGFCRVPNPWNPKQISRIDLSPSNIHAIVFWSKNPAPIFEHLDELDALGLKYVFLFTLNDYPPMLEARVPPLKDRIRAFQKLSARLGRERVAWRYDPIIISRDMPCSIHARNFARIADALDGCTDRVILSLVDYYRKTDRWLAAIEKGGSDVFCRDPFALPGFWEMMHDFVATASVRGMNVQSCCEDERLSAYGIPAGACIDAAWLSRVFKADFHGRKDDGQRANCLCAVSRDIGVNDTCAHGCAYCYATRSAEVGLRHNAAHDPKALSL